MEGGKRTSRGSQAAFMKSKQKGKIACRRANRNKHMLARGLLQYKYIEARKAKTYHILRDKGSPFIEKNKRAKLPAYNTNR